MTKTVETLRFQRTGGWCEPAAVEPLTYHFRAGIPKGFFRVDVSRMTALRYRACWSLKRQYYCNLSGTADKLIFTRLKIISWDGFFILEKGFIKKAGKDRFYETAYRKFPDGDCSANS